MARKPIPARTDAPPMPNSRPSWRPAVPPPPVSGAAVGYGIVDWAGAADGRAECVGAGVADRVAGADVSGEPEAEALAVALDLADALLVAVGGLVDEDRPPVGDGVLVTGWVVDPDGVSGVGVKVAGTEVPPAVQAETAIASRTAPAARRPAVSHASRVVAGTLSRIFMDPPRMRVRYTRWPVGPPGGRGLSSRSFLPSG
jgi:hypothetical protein